MLFLWLLCYLTASTAFPDSRFSSKQQTWNQIKTGFVPHNESDVCRTTHCVNIASSILKNRNLSVDPCEDYYEYACGLWLQNNPMPDNELEWSQNQVVGIRTLMRIRDLLEEEINDSDILPVKMVKQLYRSCMDVDTIEMKGISPISEILERTGGWPVAMSSSAWNSNIKWQEVDLQYLTLNADSAFYSIKYIRDEVNTDRHILKISQDVDIFLNAKKNLGDSVITFDDTYMNGISKVVQAFAEYNGYTIEKERVIKDIAEMVIFELGLQKIANESDDEKRNQTYERMTIKDLQKWYDSFGAKSPTAQIDFYGTIHHMFAKAGVDIQPSEPIVVQNKASLHKLAQLLESTKPRVIVNFVQWNMAYRLLPLTNEKMTNVLFNIFYEKYNITQKMDRWRFCVSEMEMKDAVSYLFVKKYFSDSVIDQIKDMINGIRQELEMYVTKSGRSSNRLKKFVVKKLENMILQIGYPDWYRNETALLKKYEGLSIGWNFFKNVLNCGEHELKESLRYFRANFDRTEWLDYAVTVNSFYSETTNALIIPAAELQDPYFTQNVPDAVNYGAVGFVIGHELSHSFDNDGIQHDEEGKKVSNISGDALRNYEHQALCFADQFNNYTLDIDGDIVELDGDFTENENIADSTGIQAAFAAYKKARAKRNRTFLLPGLEGVSEDELFFLSFANMWCSASRPSYELDLISIDEHSPPKYRVIGSLSNMEAFSKTYKCSPSSRMNRKEKCSLWN